MRKSGGTTVYEGLGRRLLVMLVVMGLIGAGLDHQYQVVHPVAVVPVYRLKANGATLTRIVTGLLWHTQFRHRPQTQHLYNYNGSAVATRRFVEWHPGSLGIGVNEQGLKEFRGYFAETKTAFPSDSYVETLMRPYLVTTQKGQSAETIVAVQTSNTIRTGLINYVIVSLIQQNGLSPTLLIGYANGLVRNAKTYIKKSVRFPGLIHMVRHHPVIINTNGNNQMTVWLGNRLLYTASHLHMEIQPPFQVYLEVQAQNMQYVARFRRFRVFRSNNVRFQGLPAASLVTIRTHGHKVLQGRANQSGTYTVHLPLTSLGLDAQVTVSAAGKTYAFPSGPLSGGDVFQFTSGILNAL